MVNIRKHPTTKPGKENTIPNQSLIPKIIATKDRIVNAIIVYSTESKTACKLPIFNYLENQKKMYL